MSEVVLYVGEDCSLCEEAAEMLDDLGVAYRRASDPAYAERVPVVVVDGRIVTEGRVSPRAVRIAVRRAERDRPAT